MRFKLYAGLLALLLMVLFVAEPASAQRRFMPSRSKTDSIDHNLPVDVDGSEFHFVRLIYGGNGFNDKFSGRGQSWITDWPEAEHFFIQGVKRLSNIDVTDVSLPNGQGGERIRLTEDNVYDYPFLYAVEVGHWNLSNEEAAILRDYLLRGGFFMVDDFHGTQEWEVFMASMRKVFPDRPVVEIEQSSEILHTVYDLDKTIQIPGLAALYNGVTFEKDGFKPDYRGIYDDHGRLMVMINHNMDMGDAWENADLPEYPEKMTALAYRFAVNYVVYAMTH
jgi:hypothetical protein